MLVHKGAFINQQYSYCIYIIRNVYTLYASVMVYSVSFVFSFTVSRGTSLVRLVWQIYQQLRNSQAQWYGKLRMGPLWLAIDMLGWTFHVHIHLINRVCACSSTDAVICKKMLKIFISQKKTSNLYVKCLVASRTHANLIYYYIKISSIRIVQTKLLWY